MSREPGENLSDRVVRLEAKLEEARKNDRFRLVVESAPNGILVADRDGRIILSNPQAERMFGYTRQELLSIRIEDLVPENFRSGHVERREKFHEAPARRGMGEGRDLYALRQDGVEFPVEIALTPMPVGDDVHVLASIIDITERKKSEERIRCYAKELERSNAELESFASVASHDLQEPLRKIRTMGQRLADISRDELGEKGRDYLDRMIGASDNMQRLIRDLLAFSRVSTRAQPFRRVELSAPLEEALSNLEVAIEESGAKIQADPLPAIDADEGQILQLFQNLIGNGIKFVREGTAPEIEIRSRIEGEDCLVEVRDNGIGFDEKYHDRIFSIFQRLHGKGRYEGTGIGLAICKKIVERHQGAIRARSTPGEGSAFEIRLPLRQVFQRQSDDS